MVAPGDPVPPTSGNEDDDCDGATKLVCAPAGVRAAVRIKAAATMNPAPNRETLMSHPRITAFVDLNRGNLMPRRRR